MRATAAKRALELALAAVTLAAMTGNAAGAAGNLRAWRFDCGTDDSPVAAGYRRLTARHAYSARAGFGWEKGNPSSAEVADFPDIKQYLLYPYMLESLDDLNRDSVTSVEDLTFRLDLSPGTYRVRVVIGDMSQALGSIDVLVNGAVAAEHVSAWTPGTRGPGNHRRILMNPYGWWTEVRHTAEVRGTVLRIELRKNQSYYDRMLAAQEAHEAAWDPNYRAHYQRIGLSAPPYYFVGWPFARHSVMAIEVVPHRPAPLASRGGRLELSSAVVSPALRDAVGRFNQGDYAGARAAAERATERGSQVPRAILDLWLAGRLELEEEKTLVPRARATLAEHARSHPEDSGVAELAADAAVFERALELHLTRGQIGKNHFIENVKAIGRWWLIPAESPLYDKARLYVARSAHMLVPYFPTRGTEREIFAELEKKYPRNRHVKYHLHYAWEPHGDGSRREDWRLADHGAKVKDSPEWVRELYPAYAGMLDLSEWWFTHRVEAEGGIGGGWGDDVELLGVFAYMGYSSRDASRILIPGVRKFMNGLWGLSEIDPDLGFCLMFSDAEHVSEYTGNTLGMMVQIDYGNPVWIERSMQTAKLMRDLWTDFNVSGRRHFRANYFAATQIGSGFQTNDSWINYRAIRPASAVLDYNRNPAIAQLYTELADAWFAAAMSTARGKPAGVIPAEMSFPEGLAGGVGSPDWYTARNTPETGNEDWPSASAVYKGYLQDLFFRAYDVTRDARYFEPMRIEYELAARHGAAPAAQTGARLQPVPSDAAIQAARGRPETRAGSAAEPGSERWVAENVKGIQEWFVARRVLEARKGRLENDLTKADIVRKSRWTVKELHERWPLMTTEAGPTDRVAFAGCVNPFLIYTGGRIGGPMLEAAVTYGNTTREFAAAVLGSDAQGFRLLYHSLAPEAREVEIYPWYLEPGGAYLLRFGPDANEDEAMDSITREERFVLPQAGAPIRIRVAPRTTYVVEVDQLEKGKPIGLHPDPALSADDIRYDPRWGLVLARIHNVGSKAVRDLTVAAYDGDPKAGGSRIGVERIPNLEAPTDLEPKTVTVGFRWKPARRTHEIHVVIDPERKLGDEITTLNNAASRRLEVDPERVIPEFRGGQ